MPQSVQNAVQSNRADGPVRLEAAADGKPGADEDAAFVLEYQVGGAVTIAHRDSVPNSVHAARAVGQDDVLDVGFSDCHGGFRWDCGPSFPSFPGVETLTSQGREPALRRLL